MDRLASLRRSVRTGVPRPDNRRLRRCRRVGAGDIEVPLGLRHRGQRAAFAAAAIRRRRRREHERPLLLSHAHSREPHQPPPLFLHHSLTALFQVR